MDRAAKKPSYESTSSITLAALSCMWGSYNTIWRLENGLTGAQPRTIRKIATVRARSRAGGASEARIDKRWQEPRTRIYHCHPL